MLERFNDFRSRTKIIKSNLAADLILTAGIAVLALYIYLRHREGEEGIKNKELEKHGLLQALHNLWPFKKG